MQKIQCTEAGILVNNVENYTTSTVCHFFLVQVWKFEYFKIFARSLKVTGRVKFYLILYQKVPQINWLTVCVLCWPIYREIQIRILKLSKNIILAQCSVLVFGTHWEGWKEIRGKAICNVLPSPFFSCTLLKRTASLTNTISKKGIIISPALKDFLSQNQPLLWFHDFPLALNSTNKFLSTRNTIYLCVCL